MITKLLTKPLEKDALFDFNADCLSAFITLKNQLIQVPTMIAPAWGLPFGLICDASDYAVGAVLRQRREKRFHPVYDASKTLTSAQENYTLLKKSYSQLSLSLRVSAIFSVI